MKDVILQQRTISTFSLTPEYPTVAITNGLTTPQFLTLTARSHLVVSNRSWK